MTPWILDPLMFGAAAALLQGDPRFDAALARMRPAWVPLLATGFLLCTAPLAHSLRGVWTLLLGPTLESFSILLVLLWLVRHPRSVVGRIANCKVVSFIGILSYGLYLWQQLFVFQGIPGRWKTPSFPWNYLYCFAAAVGSYFLIEKPFLYWKRKFAR